MALLAELRWSPSETGQVDSAKNADSHPVSLGPLWELGKKTLSQQRVMGGGPGHKDGESWLILV